jgi:hypothetical protein
METGRFWQILTIGTSEAYLERIGDRYVGTLLDRRDLSAEGDSVAEVKQKLSELVAERLTAGQ